MLISTLIMMNQTGVFNITETSYERAVAPIFVTIPSSLRSLLWFETIAACFTYGIGFLGNCLALVVFGSLEEFRKISTGVLFLLITISNFFHLWTLATEFIAVYGFSVYPNVFLQCRLNFFVQNVSRAMSTYFSVTVAVDRFLRSEKPLRSRELCTVENVFKLAGIYLVIFSLFWSYYLLPMSSQDPNTGDCLYSQVASYQFFLVSINIPIRAVFLCFIPAIIMSASNLRMLLNIHYSHKRVADAMNTNRSTTIAGISTVSSNQTTYRMSAVDRMLFYMMLANVVTFLVTQIPFHTYTVIRAYINTFTPYTHLLIYAFLLIWSSLYFGLAFYVYCLASPLFRKKFIKISKRFLHHIYSRCVLK